MKTKVKISLALFLVASIGLAVFFVSCEKEAKDSIPSQVVNLPALKSDSSALFKNATLVEMYVNDSDSAKLKSASTLSYGDLMAAAYNVNLDAGKITGITLEGKYFSDSYNYTAVASVKSGNSWVFFGTLLNTNVFYGYFSNSEGTIGADINGGQSAYAAFKKPSSRTNGTFYCYVYGYSNTVVDILLYRRAIPVCNPLDFTTTTPDNQLPSNSCVAYIRAKIPVLGTAAKTPLNSYDEKKAACNVLDINGNITNNIIYAKVGMAIVGPSANYQFYGHIAYLTSINADGSITVTEGNSGSTFNKRTIYPDNRLYKDPITEKTLYGFQCQGFINPCLIQ